MFLHGPTANKFIFSNDGNVLTTKQPPSFSKIFGKRNMTELIGDDHKRVRGALVSFLKPDMLKMYVERMDGEVQKHLNMHWLRSDRIQVMPSMKILTFNIMSSLIFGLEQGPTRDMMLTLLQKMMNGVLSLPINLPFTSYSGGVKASAKIRSMIMELVHEKKVALKLLHKADPNHDLISCLLSLRNQDDSMFLTDEEIVDNTIGVMVAGYDTSSVLITFLVRALACNQSVYAAVLQGTYTYTYLQSVLMLFYIDRLVNMLFDIFFVEQEEIGKSKASGEALTWEDLGKMKYTWRVAMETLRMYPPLIGSFRRVLKDFEYKGYTIPKDWNVCSNHSFCTITTY